MSKELTPMSASRIKTLKECGWKYFAKYKLKLPDTTNDGAIMGSIVHEALEDIFAMGNGERFEGIKRCGAQTDPEIFKAVEKKAVDMGVGHMVDHIFEMMNRAVGHDFFGDEFKQPIAKFSEMDFDIVKETEFGPFRILGFIDMMFLYADGTALVRDFKTSKKMFEGKDAEENLQDQMYTYAAKHSFGDDLKVEAEFLFLKFDLSKEGTLKMKPISGFEHSAFEIELAEWQKFIESYDENSALANLAANQPYPTDKSFSGPIMCGRAKSPNELKKDGTKMWHCPFKFGFDFYVLMDAEGKVIKSCFEADLDSMKLEAKEGNKIKKRKYSGCPAFRNLNANLST